MRNSNHSGAESVGLSQLDMQCTTLFKVFIGSSQFSFYININIRKFCGLKCRGSKIWRDYDSLILENTGVTK